MGNRRDRGKFSVLEKDVPEHEKLSHDQLCNLISEETGFAKSDIKKVIHGYHKVLCEQFGSGKRFYNYHGYFKIRLQKRKEWISKNFGREPVVVPERDTFVVTIGTIYNLAINHINHKARRAIDFKTRQYKKRGEIPRP